MKFSVITIIFIFLLNFQSVFAQNMGVKFESMPSWNAVKEKSKKENKIIFLDAYTTWCIPCREMAVKVLAKKEAGDFFNKNFINVSVQFDKNKKDNKHIKGWYKDVDYLRKPIVSIAILPIFFLILMENWFTLFLQILMLKNSLLAQKKHLIHKRNMQL